MLELFNSLCCVFNIINIYMCMFCLFIFISIFLFLDDNVYDYTLILHFVSALKKL